MARINVTRTRRINARAVLHVKLTNAVVVTNLLSYLTEKTGRD